jgi:hypothetical protein
MCARQYSTAGKKERQLSRLREQHGAQDQQNIDLTYAVILNMAHQVGWCRLILSNPC